MKTLPQIVEILSKTGYLKSKLTNKTICNVNILPLGQILLQNIRFEWMRENKNINTYTAKCSTVASDDGFQDLDYFRCPNFRENLLHIKHNFQKDWPLAMREEIAIDTNVISNDILKIILPQDTILSTCYFFSDRISKEKFYSIQREHKIWWMKFSTNPGRYNLSEMRTDVIENQKIYSVKIKSQFSFGELPLESIQMLPLRALKLDQPNDFRLRDFRLNKNDLPAVVHSTISLKSAMFALLFDSIEDNQKSNLAIHRKLAPYQCRIFALCKDETFLTDLGDLAEHLTNVISKAEISTFNSNCNITNEENLNNVVAEMDRIGVPYSIILDEKTLENGLMKLRNRDTTLSETIHISDVPNYLVRTLNA